MRWGEIYEKNIMLRVHRCMSMRTIVQLHWRANFPLEGVLLHCKGSYVPLRLELVQVVSTVRFDRVKPNAWPIIKVEDVLLHFFTEDECR